MSSKLPVHPFYWNAKSIKITKRKIKGDFYNETRKMKGECMTYSKEKFFLLSKFLYL